MTALTVAAVARMWQVDEAAVAALVRDGEEAALWELRLHLDALRCMAVTQPDSSATVDPHTWRTWRERAAAVAVLLGRAEDRARREPPGQMRLIA